MTDDDMIMFVLDREGSQYTNLPADKGGPTKYGITQATLSRFMDHQVDINVVKGLRKIDAAAIYRKVYLSPFDFIEDPDLKFLLFDSAVQHGVTKAIVWLQKAAEVNPDGHIGPITKRAIEARRDHILFKRIYSLRMSYYGMIVKNNPSQSVFINGWMNRLGDVLKVSEL